MPAAGKLCITSLHSQWRFSSTSLLKVGYIHVHAGPPEGIFYAGHFDGLLAPSGVGVQQWLRMQQEYLRE
jgi:hypothetical protein